MNKFNLKSIVYVGLLVSSPLHAGMFNTYDKHSDVFRTMLNQPASPTATQEFDKLIKSKDAILFLLEQGRLQQVALQYEQSISTYKQAFELLDKQENAAKISASRLGFKALSMLSNDSVVPYLVPPYEQVLAHVSQAKNYLAVKNPEAAGVEMRNAQRIQREIELAHQKEIEKAKDSSDKVRAEDSAKVDEALAGLDVIAGRVKNSYQNAYAFYMAANLWEALGEYNDALVDYKKAYELQPDEQIAKDVKRLDRLVTNKSSSTSPVVIFVEQGIVPKKIENKLSLPTYNGLINIAFATYEPTTYQQPEKVTVMLNGTRYNGYVITDIGALAVKTLKEKNVNTMTSQIVRATAKTALQKEMGNRLGIFGELAGNVMNMASERADLRAWSTLPSNVQVVRLDLAPGTHTLKLSNTRVNAAPLTIDVQKNQTTFVYAYDVNDQINTTVSSVAY